jgi:hypothetical protein
MITPRFPKCESYVNLSIPFLPFRDYNPASRQGGFVLRITRKQHRAFTVRQTWRAELPSEKLLLYNTIMGNLQSAHVIFSIALNEAIGLRRTGHTSQACEQVKVSGELCERFASSSEGMLRVMDSHAQNFGSVPSVDPLDREFFQSTTARNAAWNHATLTNVVWSSRSRFFYKMHTLGELGLKLAAEFNAIASTVSAGPGERIGKEWDHLATLQFDLTTTLGETNIVLKSFLVELPGAQLESFQKRVMTALSVSSADASGREAPLRRQWSDFAGAPCAPERRRG